MSIFLPAPRSTRGKPQRSNRNQGERSPGPGGWLAMRAPERATLAATQYSILPDMPDQQSSGDRGGRTTHVRRGSARARESRSRGSRLYPRSRDVAANGTGGAACRCPCLCGHLRAFPCTPGVEVGGWTGGKCSPCQVYATRRIAWACRGRKSGE